MTRDDTFGAYDALVPCHFYAPNQTLGDSSHAQDAPQTSFPAGRQAGPQTGFDSGIAPAPQNGRGSGSGPRAAAVDPFRDRPRT
jgi:hypothetical protein